MQSTIDTLSTEVETLLQKLQEREDAQQASLTEAQAPLPPHDLYIAEKPLCSSFRIYPTYPTLSLTEKEFWADQERGDRKWSFDPPPSLLMRDRVG